jgi:vitamin B12 transporter
VKRTLRWLPLPACFVLLLAVGSARAAEEGDPGSPGQADPVAPEVQGPVHELDPLVVRSTRVRESGEDPSSFTTVIRPEQFASQFRTTDDLISRTPGVNVKRYGGLGQLSTVSIRGSSSEQVLVLLDGIQLNTGEGGTVDFSTIPVESIEKIEVIRGGGTTIYGSDAIGGVVNIVTRKPDRPADLSAAFSYGSLNTLKGWLTASGKTKGISGLASFTHFQSDGDFQYETIETYVNGVKQEPGEEQTRLNNDFYSDNLLLKADVDLARKLCLTLNNDFFYSDRGQAGTVFDPRLFARQNLLSNLTHVRLEKKEFLLPDLNVFLTPFSRYDWNHFTDPQPALGSLGGNPIDTTTRDWAYGAQAGADLFVEFWKTSHGLAFRGEFQREDLVDEVPPWDPGYDDPTRMSYQWHLQDEVVLPGGLLSLIPAVHYEESTDFGGHWTGKIGAIARPWHWVHLRANFENSYRIPSFGELYFPDQGYIRGNPNLEPEKGVNLDAGFGLDFSRFFFEAAYFRNWIEQSILWLPVSRTLVMPVNTGPVDQWGVEVDTEYRPLDFLFLSANYTFLRAIAEQTGEQQSGRPEHTVNFRASAQHDLGEIYAEGQYMSRMPVHYTDTAQSSVNPRTLVDLGITVNLLALPVLKRADPIRKWTLTFEVKNVGDVSAYDSVFFPLPGRMFFVTIQAAL